MNARERFRALMAFAPFDRLPVVEWAGWWDQTIARWHGEGLPPALTDRYAICRHFGLDLYLQAWYRAVDPRLPDALWHACVPLKGLADYERLRPWLYPRDVVNVRELEEWAQQREQGEAVIWITLEGFFWFPRMLLGIEQHLLAFYDQPDLLRQINADLLEHDLRVLEQVGAVCAPDFMAFAEDMSYNHGPMLSRAMFDEFLLPCYRAVLPAVKRMGTIPLVDSDGDVTELAYWLEAAGIEGLLPLERQAGVDIARLRAEHPTMRFVGHYDKRVMHQGASAMRREFERLLPVAARGGFIVSCDHQTPPEVSYADYRLYLDLFREYAAEAGRRSRAARMP